jgi:hypothetical protein
MNESRRRVIINLASSMPMDRLTDLADHVGEAVGPVVKQVISGYSDALKVRQGISFEVVGERWVPADAKSDVMQQNLDEIARICGLAGIGSEGQSYIDRVMQLHQRLVSTSDQLAAAQLLLKRISKNRDGNTEVGAKAAPSEAQEAPGANPVR